jgi:hypothetical protein
MRVASYAVKRPDGRSADISVVAMGGGAGGELENVNRWRNQIGLDPVTEADLAGLRSIIPRRQSAGGDVRVGRQEDGAGRQVHRANPGGHPAGRGDDRLLQDHRRDALVAEQKTAIPGLDQVRTRTRGRW